MVETRGNVDICPGAFVAGWAAIDGRGSPVSVLVNGRIIGGSEPTIERPDLVPEGIDPLAGFTFSFPEPLGPNDIVEVRFRGGDQIPGSPTTMHRARILELTTGIDVAHHEGIEIGALDRPILAKSTSRVKYVDHATRADLIKKYLGTGSVSTLTPERIADVDIVWPGGSLREIIGETELDYCLSSQVIEHVPDVISWLQAQAEVLRPSGVVNMAVPDKECTFDYNRPTSLPADFVDAYLRKLTRPTAKQVFDHIISVSPLGQALIPPTPELIVEALSHARSAEAGIYHDVHCHVFSQASFLTVFEVLAHAGLMPLKLIRFFPTRPRANEFIVSLQPAGDLGPSDIAATYRHARNEHLGQGDAH